MPDHRSNLEIIAASRQRIWDELLKVARPDSRFHWDFAEFIADFEGSPACSDRVRALDAYATTAPVFITPDNSTEDLRMKAMADGKKILMTTYGIRRGFLLLDPADVPAEDRRYAATLDGMDRYATPVTMAELRQGPVIELLVTGGSAVSANGVRFGKGHGYFDLEWAMLSEIGRVNEASQIVDVVHDCQVVDEHMDGEDHDVAVDWIITPTRTIHIPQPGRRIGHIRWEWLPGTELEFLPPINELRAEREARS
ncbi:MAG TPA: 5-formyltetrahydrofolate cyclo-ligase [Propioniciclava tarda]|nr:5-formyltetrahydrofolate cyclo-ligase [Propioniciclava tarda]HQA30653.1 5-formyltetrahydrofolate cyclo-ligase [Propioniciclava tarda]HQD60887.1 5-formyltetrahydrofolate cyclo-ligase [Propioniciclava tarda]